MDSVQRFLADVAALSNTSRDKVAVAMLMDLTNIVISNALLHELATLLAGLPEDAFHLILYSGKPRGFYKIIIPSRPRLRRLLQKTRPIPRLIQLRAWKGKPRPNPMTNRANLPIWSCQRRRTAG